MNRFYFNKSNRAALFFAMTLLPSGIAYSQVKKDTVAKENKIDESDFYAYYGSLEALKQDIWLKLFENAKQTIESDANFLIYSQKDKVLTLYFTLVEVLNLNRSYVSFALKEDKNAIKNVKQLKSFRNHFKSFIVDIVETQSSEQDVKLNKIIKPLFSEGIWLEFLFILKF